MVSLDDMLLSNAQIARSLPSNLVAVFVGATSGIGEASLKEFARSCRSSRVYFIGRSHKAAEAITKECQKLSPETDFVFLQCDVSLISNADKVCQHIQSREKTINLLFLSCGTLQTGVEDTVEGLPIAMSVGYYARTRFIFNLLPLLQRANGLRRVVSVLAGGHEGPIDADFEGRSLSMLKIRGHVASMTDMALEKLAELAPEVSFVHNFPGAVKSGIGREANTLTTRFLSVIIKLIGPLVFMSGRESGERHLYFATSAKFPPCSIKDEMAGVPMAEGGTVARGTNGDLASGVYSVHFDGEGSSVKVVDLLATFRERGLREQAWHHTLSVFEKTVGASEA